MRGLTGYLFRNCYAAHFKGVDWAVTPFLTTFQGTRMKAGRLQEVTPENNRAMPTTPQILSKTAEKFITLARLLFDMGYETVNWNLGCPFPRVAQKKRGSGLLPHPELIDEFLETVLAAIPNRLSIKTRLGRHHSEELTALLPVFNRYPIQDIIIHPRTGIQMYTGTPDLDSFERCAGSLNARVIYNGDINTLDDFLKLQHRFSQTTSSWMLGRGVLANPFLPTAIKGDLPNGPERMNRFKAFHDDLFRTYADVRHGPAHLVDSMKGYWAYFALSFPNGQHVLKKIRKTRHPDHYQSIVNDFFDSEDSEKCFV